MGLGQKILTRVGPGQPFMVWVWIWKISLKKYQIFQFFSLQIKKKLFGSGPKVPVSASYLLWVKSKLGSGRVGSGPISNLSMLSFFSIAAELHILFCDHTGAKDHVCTQPILWSSRNCHNRLLQQSYEFFPKMSKEGFSKKHFPGHVIPHNQNRPRFPCG